MEGTPVYSRLIHTDVWQKPSRYCTYPPIKKNKNEFFGLITLYSCPVTSKRKFREIKDFSRSMIEMHFRKIWHH